MHQKQTANAAEILDAFALSHLAAYAERWVWSEETLSAVLSLVNDDPALVLTHGWDEIEHMTQERVSIPAGDPRSAFNLDGSWKANY